MTTFPGSPRLTKGAIVGMDPLNPLASVIVFQYNPKSLTRRLDAQSGGEGSARSEVLRLNGPPAETITIGELEIDAADQLEQAQAAAVGMGIAPQLAALEMLLYPKSALVIANTVLLAAGIRTFRHSPGGEPRGVFCGMGVCFECRMIVDGRPNVRTCMTPAHPGCRVERQADSGPEDNR